MVKKFLSLPKFYRIYFSALAVFGKTSELGKRLP